jgi:hypothetical protein
MDERSISLREGYTVIVHMDARHKDVHVFYGMKPRRRVMVAQLTEDSLWKVKQRVVPSLWLGSTHAVPQCGHGALSSGRECMCIEELLPAGSVFAACERVRKECRTFLPANRFEGVSPLGAEHWWKGVTDAVDAGSEDDSEHYFDRWLAQRAGATGFAASPFPWFRARTEETLGDIPTLSRLSWVRGE